MLYLYVCIYLRIHVVFMCGYVLTYSCYIYMCAFIVPCCIHICACIDLSVLYLCVHVYLPFIFTYPCCIYMCVCIYLSMSFLVTFIFTYLSYIYLTIIPRGRVGYEMKIANETRSVELAIIISYPTSESGIIVLLKTPTKSRWISPT